MSGQRRTPHHYAAEHGGDGERFHSFRLGSDRDRWVRAAGRDPRIGAGTRRMVTSSEPGLRVARRRDAEIEAAGVDVPREVVAHDFGGGVLE